MNSLLDSDCDVHYPISTPSSGRSAVALLHIFEMMGESKYVDIVVAKSKELASYKEHWPTHTFYELPEEADEKGIGCSRLLVACIPKVELVLCGFQILHQTTS